jgi:argininosuccinate synthase
VLPALRAGALDDGASVRALEAPIVARTLVEVCGIEQAAAIAHCATGASRTRLEAALLALAASASVLAPAASWRMTRADRVEYARLHHAPWSETPEDGDPTPRAAADPKEPASVDIRFDRGAPLALNGIDMPLSDLLDTLATIAGAHGIEAPAAAVLQAAHDSLIGGVADLARFRSLVTREYRDIVLGGRWFSPLRQALDAFVTAAADRVSGVVRLTLFKGEARTAVVDRTPGPRVIAVEARA